MPRSRRKPQSFQQTIVASAARTTTGNGTGTANGYRAQVAKLDVTAASGTTPSLTVTIQDSPDGSAWTTRDTFAAKTTTGTETRPLPRGLDTNIRAAWTISGTTPSFTFSVQVASHDAALV
jgi:hypothetical protein